MSNELPELPKIPDNILVSLAHPSDTHPPDERVRVGSLLLPRTFRLLVAYSREEPVWMVTLGYRVHADLEIGLQTVDALGLDVPSTLDELRSILPLAEWQRVAITQVVIRDLGAQLGHDAASWIHEPDWRERRAVADWLKEHFGDAVDGSPPNFTEAEEILGRVKATSTSPPHRRTRVTAAHLEKVADAYRTASADGAPPTRAVADQFEVSHSTAARWVGMARKRDLLPPTEPGKERA